MMETHLIYKAAIDAVGAKKVAASLNLSLQQAYRLAQPIEADGVRSDIDRLEHLADVLASHAEGRKVLTMLRLHFDAVFRRTVDHDQPAPLTDDKLAEKAGLICNEVGDLLRRLQPGFDAEEVSKEASEVIVAVEKLMRALHQQPCTRLRPPLRAS